ncbi:CotH kinase family protein [candidate division KSB1 bacterium]|nr:CotH kinase family protein [candidate division KSB1 bacterium]
MRFLFIFFNVVLLFFPGFLSSQDNNLDIPESIYIPGYDKPFTSSNLPIVIIDTHGQNIPYDNPRLIADMGVIDNGRGSLNRLTDPINGYSSKISIEIRGESSADWKKKQYSIETQDETRANRNVPLLGFPAENDWILNAPYIDKSLMRNVLIFRLSNDLGLYSSRSRFFELILNGKYNGIYVLLEKIKRDSNRVNISNLRAQDNQGDQLTGGYILRIDKTDRPDREGVHFFTSGYMPYAGSAKQIRYQYRYPESENITPQQKNYIKDFINRFENTMYGSNFNNPVSGYPFYININSFVDVFILNELSKNVDAYRLSAYMYKDRDSKGGRLSMGPLWDYNLAFGNANYYDGTDTDDWILDVLSDPAVISHDTWQTPFWWSKLVREEKFNARIYDRWFELRRDVLSIRRIYQYIDTWADTLRDAQERNFAVWSGPGDGGEGFWPVPAVFRSFKTYHDEINYLKKWTGERIIWMDENISILANKPAPETKISDFYLDQNYPNPFNTFTTFQYYLPEPGYVVLKIYDLQGRRVRTLVQAGNRSDFQQITWDGLTDSEGAAASGVYLYDFKARAAKHTYSQTGRMTLIR